MKATIESINPATEEKIRSYKLLTPQQLNKVLEESRHAFGEWSKTKILDRSKLMEEVPQILRAKKNGFAKLMAEEMGKLFPQGQAEIEKCIWLTEYYAQESEHFLAPELIQTDAQKSYVSFEPLGTILAVMPWNFPFWQVFRCSVPALMAGNAVILKHASNVPGCALEIEDIFIEAGFPHGIFQTILTDSTHALKLIEHPVIKAISLTGSTQAGKAIAKKAGECLKKSVLELGGSDPYIILEDASLNDTVETCVKSRLINSGQSCIAAKRFIVVKSILKPFEELFVEKMRSQKMGPPTEEGVTVGPLARKDLRNALHSQVLKSVKKGATLLLGGKIPKSKGAFYEPTVLTNVTKGMPAYSEETFGPVAAIISAENTEDAIRIANDSAYGLGAAIFTKNLGLAERLAQKELDAGSVFVNDIVHSDPRLPFGGIKESGYGRELSSFGIREFTNIKTVYIKNVTSNRT